MDTIANRIKTLRIKRKMTQKELAQKLNLNKMTISQWEIGNSKPKADSVISMSKLFNVDIDWLNKGGQGVVAEYSDRNENVLTIPYFINIDSIQSDGSKILLNNVDDYLAMPKEVLQTLATNLVCIRINGDSMEPILKHNSLVFIDLDYNRCDDGSVYIISHDGMLRVKFLEKTPCGYLLKSFNHEYKTIEIRTNEVEFHIIGKVILKIGCLN